MDEDDIMCYLCIGLIVFLIVSGIIICNDNARIRREDNRTIYLEGKLTNKYIESEFLQTNYFFELNGTDPYELRGFDKEDVFYNFSIGDYIYIYKSGRITKMEEKE